MANSYYQAIQGQIPDISKNAYLQNATLQEAIKNIGGAFTGLAQSQRDQNTNGILGQIIGAQDPSQLQALHPAIQQQLAQQGQGVDQIGVLNAFNQQRNALGQQAQAQADRSMQLGNIADQSKVASAYAQGGVGALSNLMSSGALNNNGNALTMLAQAHQDIFNNAKNDREIQQQNNNNLKTNAEVTTSTINDASKLASASAGNDGKPQKETTWVDSQGNVHTLTPPTNGQLMGLSGSTSGALNSISAKLGGQQGNQLNNSYNSQYQNRDWLNGASLTDMSLGDLRNVQRGMVDATRNPATKLGTSPMGRYGIVGTTLEDHAKQLYGNNWQSQQFTPQVQDQLAERIYNGGRNGDMTKVFEGLSNVPGASKPGAFKNIPFSQVKDMIARYESGYSDGFNNPLSGSTNLPSPSDSGSTPSNGKGNSPLSNANLGVKVDADDLQAAQSKVSRFTENSNIKSNFTADPNAKSADTRQFNQWLVDQGYASGPTNQSSWAMGGDNVRKVNTYNALRGNAQFNNLSSKDKQDILTQITSSNNAEASAPLGGNLLTMLPRATFGALSNALGGGYSKEKINNTANTLITDIVSKKKGDAVTAERNNYLDAINDLRAKSPNLSFNAAAQAISKDKYNKYIVANKPTSGSVKNPYSK
jgi:hypothetical protein